MVNDCNQHPDQVFRARELHELLDMSTDEASVNITRSRLGRLTRQGFLTQPGRGRYQKRTQRPLKEYTHVAGVAVSNAAHRRLPLPPDEDAPRRAGQGFQRGLPLDRVREAIVIPRRILLPEQTSLITRMCDAEAASLNWALAKLGVPGVSSLLSAPPDPRPAPSGHLEADLRHGDPQEDRQGEGCSPANSLIHRGRSPWAAPVTGPGRHFASPGPANQPVLTRACGGATLSLRAPPRGSNASSRIVRQQGP